jgi:hypothetical protein
MMSYEVFSLGFASVDVVTSLATLSRLDFGFAESCARPSGASRIQNTVIRNVRFIENFLF